MTRISIFVTYRLRISIDGERREVYFHNIKNVVFCTPRLHEQISGKVRLL